MKKKILITGGTGLLGSSLLDHLDKIKYDVFYTVHKKKINLKNAYSLKVNLSNKTDLINLKKINFDLIINCIGLSDVENCEKNSKLTKKLNITIPNIINNFAKKNKIKLIHISTDHLYNGKKNLYFENNKTSPLNAYAKSKLKSEQSILKNNNNTLIIRTNFFCNGKFKNQSFSDKIINNLNKRKKVYLFKDVFFTPVYTQDLLNIILKGFSKNLSGIFNISTPKSISKYQFGLKIAEIFNLDKSLVIPINISEKNLITRPKVMSLSSKRIEKSLKIKIKQIEKMLFELYEDYKSKNQKLIPYGKHSLSSSDVDEVVKTLRSGHLTQGPKISELENKICKLVGCKYAVAVSSCTAGMHIALSAVNVKKKQVLLPPITFVSTANVVLMNDLKPKFIDIDLNSANLDLDKIIHFNNLKNVGAIIPVHFGGNPVDIKKLQILRKKNIKIIEDSAHALGSKYKCGSKIGSCKYSDLSVFSLHPVKTIAAGEGGIVTTNDKNLYKKLLRLRSHGINKFDDKFINKKNAYTKQKLNNWYYEMQELGFHYRITDIQASLAVSQIKRIKSFVSKRLEIYNNYSKAFSKIKGINKLDVYSKLSSHHLFILKINFKKFKISRQEFMSKLKKIGIITQVHYIPVNIHPYYQKLGYSSKSTPNAIKYYNEAISLPIYFDLTKLQQSTVINKIKNILKINVE
jgi:dTDP-4-dehydrorhamnose reductase